jgi:hypothetical protein
MEAAGRYVALLTELREAREAQDEVRVGVVEDALDALWYRMTRDEKAAASSALCVLYHATSAQFSR